MTDGRRIVPVLAGDEHADAIAEFYRATWDPAATTASVRAATRAAADRNVAEPGTPPPTALVLEGNRAIGYCGSIAQRLWNGAEEFPAYWVKGLMVLPEFRNGPIGYLAVKEVTRHLPCATILTVAPAARRLFTALGYTDLGAVSNWVRPLRPGIIVDHIDLQALGMDRMPDWVSTGVAAARRSGVASIAARGAGVAIDALAGLARLPGAHLQTSRPTLVPRDELNQLWRTVRGAIAASPVRDDAYLASRFADAEASAEAELYSFVATRERGRLVGVAVMRRPRATSDRRLGGVRVATVSDLVFQPVRTDVGLATLGELERAARAADADALICMTSHAALATLLKRQAYLRLSGNVHFFLRDVTAPGRWPTDLTSWWLARGDGESDATF